jgi:hypothetical protein
MPVSYCQRSKSRNLLDLCITSFSGGNGHVGGALASGRDSFNGEWRIQSQSGLYFSAQENEPIESPNRQRPDRKLDEKASLYLDVEKKNDRL